MINKLLLLLLLITSFAFESNGQNCAPADLKTQTAINNFPNNYPDCTVIEGDLIIGTEGLGSFYNNNNIISLQPLSQITEVKGDVIINWQNSLEDLSGLENLTKIGGDLSIFQSPDMTSIDGVGAIESIGGSLTIELVYIEDLSSFQSLTSIGGDIYCKRMNIVFFEFPSPIELDGGISILNCDSLIDVTGFNNLTEIDHIDISDVPLLERISGFSNVTRINDRLRIDLVHVLNSLEGLSKVDSIGVLEYSQCRQNTFPTLESVENIGALSYTGNHMDNLPMLPKLEVIHGDFILFGNLIDTLNGLSNVKEIKGELLIQHNDNVEEVRGFDELHTLGSLTLTLNKKLYKIYAFNGIDSITNISLDWYTIYIYGLQDVENIVNLNWRIGINLNEAQGFKKVERIHNDLIINAGQKDTSILQFESLVEIGNDLEYSDMGSGHTSGADIFPALQSIGGSARLSNFHDLGNFDELVSIGDSLSIYQGSGYDFTKLAKLKNVPFVVFRDSYASDYTGLSNILDSQSSLRFQRWDFYGQNSGFPGLEDLDSLKNLTLIDNYWSDTFEGLSGLKSISGRLWIYNDMKASEMSVFNNLSELGSLRISDTDIAEFPEFPLLREIDGDLDLHRNRYLDFDKSMSLLETIHGDIYLSENDSISSLTAFSNLSKVQGRIRLEQNKSLNCLKGMESLKFIGDGLHIGYDDVWTNTFGNGRFTHMDSLYNLDTLIGDLNFDHLPRLQNIAGLSNLEYFEGNIYFNYNLDLEDISAIDSFIDPELINSFRAIDNGNLEVCNLDFLCEFLQRSDKTTELKDNGHGCNGFDLYCEKYMFSGYVFWDRDENKAFDGDDTPIKYATVVVDPGNVRVPVDADGKYHFYAHPDTTYELRVTFSYDPLAGNGDWQLTTDSTTYQFEFESGSDINNQLDFGYKPTYSRNYVKSDWTLGYEREIETQEWIDDFPNHYPWCTEFRGSLKIEEKVEGDIIDLTPFSQITHFTAGLKIADNANLTSLNGLHNVDSIGTSSFGKLWLTDLINVSDLSGLSSLAYLRGSLIIIDLDLIEDLHPLANLNPKFISAINITNNDLLSACDVPFVCEFILNEYGSYYFEDNLATCNYDELLLCDDEVVGGTVFYDENKNKIQDLNEHGIPYATVKMNGIDILTTEFGEYYRFGDSAELYTINFDLNPSLELTTDSASYSHVFYPYTMDVNNNFGVRFIEDVVDLDVNLSSASTRCSEEVLFIIKLVNRGSISSNLRVKLQLDELTELTTSEEEPDGFDLLENSYWWNIDSLYSFQTISNDLRIQMPDFHFIGEEMDFILTVEDILTGDELARYDYLSTVRCSFDPNDKRVTPSGIEEENYTLFEDSLLTYTIRFQNTGNDFAKNILIRDTISEYLDMSTFKILNTSFPVLTEIDGRAIAFFFQDINLIDSLTNEPESHGFVTYSIETISDLEEDQKIENTAHIIFDFNPAIVTNTTSNTMVSEYPTSTADYQPPLNVKLVPNPADGVVSIINNTDLDILKLEVFNNQGRLVISQHSSKIDTEYLGSGYYVVKITFEDRNVALPLIKM